MPVPVIGRTVAVNVVLWPKLADGTARLLVITVLLARRPGPDSLVNVGLVEPRNAVSPPYVAVTAVPPTAR